MEDSEIREGMLVRVRTWEDMAGEFGMLNPTTTGNFFTREMCNLSGKVTRVQAVANNLDTVAGHTQILLEGADFLPWVMTATMLEPCMAKPCGVATAGSGEPPVAGVAGTHEKDTQAEIKGITESLCSLLQYKNRCYGDSALKPQGIFYKGTAQSSILIRLDDKLGRIRNNTGEPRVNDIVDTMGYLTLLLIDMGVSGADIDALRD